MEDFGFIKNENEDTTNSSSQDLPLCYQRVEHWTSIRLPIVEKTIEFVESIHKTRKHLWTTWLRFNKYQRLRIGRPSYLRYNVQLKGKCIRIIEKCRLQQKFAQTARLDRTTSKSMTGNKVSWVPSNLVIQKTNWNSTEYDR